MGLGLGLGFGRPLSPEMMSDWEPPPWRALRTWLGLGEGEA